MRIFINNRQDGFTLLETIIAFGVFIVLSTVLWQLFYFGSRSAARINAENELLEQSRIAMEFMTNHLRQADLCFVKTEAGAFKELHVENGTEKRGFYFQQPEGILYFGGATSWGKQELAKYIKEINIHITDNKMYIEIRSMDNVGTDVTVLPVVLQSVMDMRYCFTGSQ